MSMSGGSGGDTTPGGGANALLQEDNFGFLLEDDSGDILLES